MSPLTEPTRLRLANGQPVANDPYFYTNTVLLLHGNGTNGSTTITDSSQSPKTVTAVGNAQISTAQSKFGNTSIAFDGNGDYGTIPVSTDFEFGTGDFTIECFLFLNSVSGINKDVNIVSLGRGANGGTGGNLVTCGWGLRYREGDIYFFRYDGTSSSIVRSQTINPGSWNHVAVSRSGTSLRIFFNGSQVGATETNSIAYNRVGVGGSQDIHIGRLFSGDPSGQSVPGFSLFQFFLNGYIDDLRITKGVARYTANFTPPTAPFPDF